MFARVPSSFGKRSMRQRIGPNLDVHGKRRHAFAALFEPGRAVTL
jgi:hypothetical protein